MFKRIVSVLIITLLIISEFSIYPCYAYGQEHRPEAQEVADMPDLYSDFAVPRELADSIIYQMFGEVPESVPTEDGYEYRLSESTADEIIDTLDSLINETLSDPGLDGETEPDKSANDLPEGYVDTSNDVLDAILSRLEVPSARSVMSLSGGSKVKVDVVFVIDSTGSMSGSISGVKQHIAEFAEYLFSKGLTLRLGLIDFKDITYDGLNSTVIHMKGHSPWLTSYADFLEQLKKVTATGGGDGPETPIDALGYLTDDTTMLWNTDAFKFAVLITDAGAKTNNRHGIANMEDLAQRLAERDIYTSVITYSSYEHVYATLAAQTGGILVNISNNFSSILKDFADSVVSTATVPPVSYSIKVTDSVTGLPVSGARVSFSGGSATTGANGIAVLSSRVNPVEDFEVYKAGYETYRRNKLTLSNDMTIPIAMIAEDKNEPSGTPTFSTSMFMNPPSGNADIAAPTVTIFGKKFNLLCLPASLKLSLFDKGSLAVRHDEKNKKFSVIIGYNVKEIDEGRYWQDYALYKNIVKTFTNKTAREIMTDFTRLKGQFKNPAKLLFPVTINTAGYLDASYATGDWTYEGGVVVAAQMKNPFDISYPIPPAPYIFIKVSIRVDAKLKMAIVKVNADGKAMLTAKGELSFGPSVTGTLNLGVEKVAYVGGGIKGELQAKIKVPEAFPDAFTLKLTGSWAWEVKIGPLKFSGEEKWPHEITLFPLPFMRSLYSIDEDDGRLIQRPGAYRMLFSAAPPEFIRYDANVYDSGAPQLVQLDNGNLLLVWLGDDESRSLANASALYYSIYDGTAWTEPAQVSDDGTADFNPSLFKADDGTVHLVWQDCTQVFDEDVDLSEYIESVDISYIRFDRNGVIDCAEITITGEPNRVYEIAPEVSAYGNSVSIVWLENSENDPLLFDGTNTICRVEIEDGEVGPREIIRQGLGYVTGIASGYTNDERNVIAYTLGSFSHDGGATGEEPYIYMVGDVSGGSLIIDASTWTDEGTNLQKVNALQFVDGSLYWSDYEGIKVVKNVHSPVVSQVTDYPAGRFKVLTNGVNRAIVALTEGITNEIVAIYETGGSWTGPVRLTEYGKSIHAVSGLMDDEGVIYLAFNQVTLADESFDGAVSDRVVAGYRRKAPDLVVDEEACFPLSEAIPGYETYASVYVKNNGATDTPALQAIVTLDSGEPQIVSTLYTIPDNKSTLDEKVQVSAFKAGEEMELLVPVKLPSVLGSSHQLSIEITAVQPGADLGPSNKIARYRFGAMPDLEVAEAEITRTDYRAVVTALIRNVGYAQATNITVDLYNSESVSIGSKTITALDAGAESEIRFDVPGDELVAESEFDNKRFVVSAFTENEPIVSNNEKIVILPPLPVTAIILDKSEVSIAVGEKVNIGYTVMPEGAGNREVTWHSSNLRVAMVDGGEITGISEGSAVITAISVADGMTKASMNVYVSGEPKGVSGVSIDQEPPVISVGRKMTLSATVIPADAANKNVRWYSDNPGVVSVETVDNKGVITGVSEGTAIITVVTEDGGYTDQVIVTVTAGPKYRLNITPGTGGTVETGESGEYAEGEKIILAAVASGGYRFVKWTSSGGGVFADENSAVTTFTMPGNDVTVTAHFSPVSTGGSGSKPEDKPEAVDWNSIKNRITLLETGTIEVDMKNETTVPVGIFEAMKGKDIDVVFRFGGYSWHLNGMDIHSIPAAPVNLQVVFIREESLSELAGKNDVLQFELKHNGAFLFKITLRISAGKQYGGKAIVLYYYNEDAKSLEYCSMNTADGDGQVEFEFSHASKYILTTSILQGTDVIERIPAGADPNAYVPFLVENGKESVISMSVAKDGLLRFIAPKTAEYSFRSNAKHFDDVQGHWSRDNISFVTAREIYAGTGSDRFSPDDIMTRGMLITVLGRLHGADVSAYAGKTAFADVDNAAWYAPYVAWAAENRIVSGIGGNRFAPDQAVTREEMAVIIRNYADFAGYPLQYMYSKTEFADKDSIASWAYDAVEAVQQAGIITGKPGNIFDPKGKATRAEVAAVIRRLIEAVLIK